MGPDLTPDVIRRRFDMQPHPEGGWFSEQFRDEAVDADGRSRMTSILFLLEAGEVSHWHRVTDAVEIWHYHAGAPLVLTLSPNGHDAHARRLGPDIAAGQELQVVVPVNHWQTATSLGYWTLVGCTVAPGFEFSSFELAPPDWRPTPRKPGSAQG